MTYDLFAENPEPWSESLGAGATVLRRFAEPQANELISAIGQVSQQAEFRQMKTPGGHIMSAAMTCCGRWGWVTDQQGYRYQTTDPLTDRPWPAMSQAFFAVARRAADRAGYPGFEPDACLINRYVPGAKMGLHQDKNEKDYDQPIVSVSLGSPATFQFGGLQRNERPLRVPLEHGDVVVWGGLSRLRYHGVLTLKPVNHSLTGLYRYNLTFRRAR